MHSKRRFPRLGGGKPLLAFPVLLAGLLLAGHAWAQTIVSDNVRAGEPEYRELRFAAAMGLLGEAMPGRQPLSRRELSRLGALLDSVATGESPGRASIRFRSKRLAARIDPWASYGSAESRAARWTFAPIALIEVEWSDVRRGDAAPAGLDGGSSRIDGARFDQRMRLAGSRLDCRLR